MKSSWLALVAGTLFLFGVPLFLALDRLMLLPPSLRDRPWAFEFVTVLGVAGVVAAVRWGHASTRVSALMMGCAVVGAFTSIGIWHLSRYRELPPIQAELVPGTHVPAVTLLDQGASPVALGQIRGPLLLVVFRGVWCPYCRNELSRLAEQVPRFSSTAVRVYGISTDPPEALLRHHGSHELPFSLLSDPDQRVTGLCGFSMHCLLLFDREGTLRWGGFSESWRSPPRYEDVLQAAYRLQ